MNRHGWLSLVFCATTMSIPTATHAHSMEEVHRAFEGFPGEIPPEVIDATVAFRDSAGANSVRELAHESQHQLIQAHLRALTHRKCSEVVTSISELDRQILEQRDHGQKEEEERLRTLRDVAQTYLSQNCRSTQ